MNILVLNWQDRTNPLSGGAEVHLHEVFSRIAAAGHEVTLYCSLYPGAARNEVLDGMRIIREGIRYLFNYQVPFGYRRLVRDRSFDVVVDDMNKVPFFTPLYVREPLVCVTHHLFDRSIFKETNPVAGAYVYGLERMAVREFRVRRVPFIVGSQSTREELVARGVREEDVAVVHYAVDRSLYRPTGVPRSPVPLVGYFGRLKRYKAVDHFLLAVDLVRQRIPDIKAVVMGEGDDRPRLEKLARDKGLDCVEFTGYVPEEKKVELLQQMWVKVMTSSKEGWGLTVLEANACGTPAIASNVPGLREAVRHGETGLLYDFGDVRGLAGRILTLLEDEPLRLRLAANAISWASTLTWRRAARETLVVLERTASKK